MGYFGRIVVARSTRPLAELAAVGDVDVLDEVVHDGDWRVATLDGDLERGALRALVAETGAPALWAYVIDSDTADVTGLTPGGVSWHAYLHAETALRYGAPALADPVEDVVGTALSWAAAAGLSPAASALGEALAADGTFVEDTLDELLDALGIH